MITLSTPTFDLSGYLQLLNTGLSNISGRERRVTKTATLDGGVSIADLGYTDGDREFSIRARKVTIATEQSLSYLLENYPLVVLSCRDGVYEGALSRMARRDAELTFTFSVKQKLST